MDNVYGKGGSVPPDFWVWTLAVAVMLWVLGLSLSGCSRTVYVPVETVSYVRDSASTVDSTVTLHKTNILDSVRIKDSTVIIQDHEGNIVKEEHYRETERYRSLERAYDGLRRAYEQLKSEKVDTVSVPCPVEKSVFIEKPIKWYDKGFIWVGRLCCLAALLWALFLYLKRKL